MCTFYFLLKIIILFEILVNDSALRAQLLQREIKCFREHATGLGIWVLIKKRNWIEFLSLKVLQFNLHMLLYLKLICFEERRKCDIYPF